MSTPAMGLRHLFAAASDCGLLLTLADGHPVTVTADGRPAPPPAPLAQLIEANVQELTTALVNAPAMLDALDAALGAIPDDEVVALLDLDERELHELRRFDELLDLAFWSGDIDRVAGIASRYAERLVEMLAARRGA